MGHFTMWKWTCFCFMVDGLPNPVCIIFFLKQLKDHCAGAHACKELCSTAGKVSNNCRCAEMSACAIRSVLLSRCSYLFANCCSCLLPTVQTCLWNICTSISYRYISWVLFQAVSSKTCYYFCSLYCIGCAQLPMVTVQDIIGHVLVWDKAIHCFI